MSNWIKYLTAVTVLSLSVTGLPIISNTLANADTPNLQAQSTPRADNSVCSFITGNNVNVRSGPGSNYAVVTRLNRGDVVKAVLRRGNWVQLTAKVTSSHDAPKEVTQPLKGWVSNTLINGCSEDQFDRWRQ